jgi:TRAP-type C4-dicarboxylate transport system substrate-binding protein
MVRKMRIGQLHAAALTGEGLASIVPEMRVFQTPMFVRTDGELDYLRSKLEGKLEKLAAAQGFRLLAWSDVGWVYLFSRQPVASPDQARQLKMWIHSGDTAWAEALKEANYRPVPLPATEIYMGLQSGFVDAFNAPPVVALSSQWFALATNMMDLKWAPLVGAVVITERHWQRIPSELRPALQAAAVRATESAKTRVRSFEAEAITAMQTYGLQVNSVTQINADRFMREIRASYPKLVGAVVPAAIHAEAEKYLDEYRRSVLE